MADTLEWLKLQFIRAVASDRGLSAGARCVGTLMAVEHVNTKTYREQRILMCWPSQKTLADIVSANERQVRRYIAELVTAGYVEARRGGRGKGGDGNPSRYILKSFERTPVSSQNQHSTGHARPVKDAILTGHQRDFDRTKSNVSTGHPCPPTTIAGLLNESDYAAPRPFLNFDRVGRPSRFNEEPEPEPPKPVPVRSMSQETSQLVAEARLEDKFIDAYLREIIEDEEQLQEICKIKINERRAWS